jgi:ribonucleoside-diphosphate reductase alpha chain
MKALIDMAAGRGAFIDQSQSLNLFMENPTIGKLSSMYMYAWKNGIKTTYYLRGRPATSIAKTTVKASTREGTATTASNTMVMKNEGAASASASATPSKKEYTESEVIACSLENPEACEACQ